MATSKFIATSASESAPQRRGRFVVTKVETSVPQSSTTATATAAGTATPVLGSPTDSRQAFLLTTTPHQHAKHVWTIDTSSNNHAAISVLKNPSTTNQHQQQQSFRLWNPDTTPVHTDWVVREEDSSPTSTSTSSRSITGVIGLQLPDNFGTITGTPSSLGQDDLMSPNAHSNYDCDGDDSLIYSIPSEWESYEEEEEENENKTDVQQTTTTANQIANCGVDRSLVTNLSTLFTQVATAKNKRKHAGSNKACTEMDTKWNSKKGDNTTQKNVSVQVDTWTTLTPGKSRTVRMQPQVLRGSPGGELDSFLAAVMSHNNHPLAENCGRW